MDAIRIYSSIPFDEIDGIIKKLPFKKDINVEYTDCRDKSNYSFFTKKCRQIEEITFLNTLSDFVFEIMIKFHAIDLIKDHVDNLLKDIRIVEKDRIVEEVYLLLIDKHYFINEKEDIKEKILDFLFENNALIIDGYIRFRNKEIYDLIEKSIKRVIGDMQLEMEYSEFIDVLKHFLDNQPPRINTINVIIEEEKYQILDKDNQEIEKNSISQILEEIYCDDLTQGDILITTLINLAPEKIILHNKDCKDDKLLLVMEKVFEGRLEICLGCSICQRGKHDSKKDIKS